MKTFLDFINNSSSSPKIIISKEPDTIFRDGGSEGYYVKNTNECGYQLVVHDFSIGAKRNSTEGSWYARRSSPDHIDKYPINKQTLSFV